MNEAGRPAVSSGVSATMPDALSKAVPDAVSRTMPKAKPSTGPSDVTVCGICPHACTLSEGQLGRCRARRAHDGRVVAENYGRLTACALDPIEKKPLARFRPGSYVLSIGSYGCNLACPFCQNASIAHASANDVRWHKTTAEALVARAVAARSNGNIGIAYTYNEPLVSYEFVLDCARLAHEAGLVNVLVSNGVINPAPLAKLLPFLDAANIDLKGFTDEVYALLGGKLDAVKHAIELIAACPSCHLEVTTLVVPELNEGHIKPIASWLAGLDRDIPYHISRFFPCHHMTDRPPTSVKLIRQMADAAREHLRYVYIGNC